MLASPTVEQEFNTRLEQYATEYTDALDHRFGLVKKYNPDQPRDDHGRFGSGGTQAAGGEYGSGVGISPEEVTRMTGLVKEVARDFGYPEDKVEFRTDSYNFQVGDKQMSAAGLAHINEGKIEIFSLAGADKHEIARVMSHEIMHQKFENFRRAFNEENERFHQWVGSFGDNWRDLPLRADDSIKPEYSAYVKEHFPIREAVGDHLSNIKELSKTDGVSDYSRQYWQAWKAGTEQTTSAIHETLAEMSRLEYEARHSAEVNGLPKPGSLRTVNGEHIGGTVWHRIYRAVDRHWNKTGLKLAMMLALLRKRFH